MQMKGLGSRRAASCCSHLTLAFKTLVAQAPMACLPVYMSGGTESESSCCSSLYKNYAATSAHDVRH